MTDEEHRQLVSDFKQTFTIFEPGIRVLKYLEKICYMNETIFMEGDIYRTILREGMRILFLNIQNKLKENLEETRQETAINV